MYVTAETGKLWQTIVLLIVFLVLLMISAIAMSTDADETKDDLSSGADIPHDVTNGKSGFEKPLRLLESECDYSSDIAFG